MVPEFLKDHPIQINKSDKIDISGGRSASGASRTSSLKPEEQVWLVMATSSGVVAAAGSSLTWGPCGAWGRAEFLCVGERFWEFYELCVSYDEELNNSVS